MVHKEISDTNFMLVCNVVALMRPRSMKWEQFQYMCSLMGDDTPP